MLNLVPDSLKKKKRELDLKGIPSRFIYCDATQDWILESPSPVRQSFIVLV